ncbi:MAG: tetratricopeptide repeat protein [Kiritimatiellae bacterium]|nr:tetratricopeptide repeat protein [Kiritimatiellia bacterium]
MYRQRSITTIVLPAIIFLAAAKGCRKESPAPATVTQEPARRSPRDRIASAPAAATSRPGPEAPCSSSLLAYPSQNPFHETLIACLADGDITRAQSLYLSALRGDIEAPVDPFDPIMGTLLRSADYTAARAWADTLLREPLSPSQAATVYGHLFTALVGMKRLDLVASYVPLLVEHVLPADICRIMRPVCLAAIDANGADSFEAIIAALAGFRYRAPALQPFVVGQQMRMLVSQDRTDEAAAMVQREAALFPPAEQKAILLLIAKRLAATGRSVDDINRFAHSALGVTGLSESARDAVAAWWLADAGRLSDYNEFLHRFTSVVSAHITPSVPLGALRSSYYEIRQSGTPVQQSICSSLVNAVHTCEGLRENDRQTFALLCLDDCFLDGNYKQAQALLERGVPGQSEEWHAMIYNKLEAHAAVQEERYADAIAGFRQHMRIVQNQGGALSDPASGDSAHLGVVLGLNEGRIGDIYTEMGQPEQALAAYTRARKHCEHAISDSPDGSAPHQQATEVLESLPEAHDSLLLR